MADNSIWPAALPQASLISEYGDSIGDGRTISQVSTGVGKRRAFWSGVRALNVVMNMSSDQWLLLRNFWDAISHGVASFWMKDVSSDQQPLIDADYSAFLTDESGNPLLMSSYQLVQFGKQPPTMTEAYTSDYFKVTVPLEVLP